MKRVIQLSLLSIRSSSLSLATPRIATCPQHKPHSLDLFSISELTPLKRTQSMDIVKPWAVRATRHGTGPFEGSDLPPDYRSTERRDKRF